MRHKRRACDHFSLLKQSGYYVPTLVRERRAIFGPVSFRIKVMTERAEQRICINAPDHSTVLIQAFFFAKHHITQVCQPPTVQIYHPASCGFSQR